MIRRNQNDFIAQLRDRITIESPTSQSDSGGGENVSWNEVDRVWANVAPINSTIRNTEEFRHHQTQVKKLYRIKLRIRDDITEAMRIIFNGKTLNIRSIIVPDTSLSRMELIVEEGVST